MSTEIPVYRPPCGCTEDRLCLTHERQLRRIETNRKA